HPQAHTRPASNTHPSPPSRPASPPTRQANRATPTSHRSSFESPPAPADACRDASPATAHTQTPNPYAHPDPRHARPTSPPTAPSLADATRCPEEPHTNESGLRAQSTIDGAGSSHVLLTHDLMQAPSTSRRRPGSTPPTNFHPP